MCAEGRAASFLNNFNDIMIIMFLLSISLRLGDRIYILCYFYYKKTDDIVCLQDEKETLYFLADTSKI